MRNIDGNETFLLEEYSQCFSQMRHYDTVKLSLAKFAFSFYSAVAAVSFGLERYFYYELKTKGVDLFLGLLLFLTFLVGFLILVMLARYRKYFVLVARQVNGIRRYFFDIMGSKEGKLRNVLYTDSSKPVGLNVKSTYLLLMFLFTLVNAVTLAFACFFMLRYCRAGSWLVIVILFLASLAFQSLYIRAELKEAKI